MVLLENIFSDEGGRYGGTTENGEDVRITGVPCPEAIPIYGEKEIDGKLKELRNVARTDNTRYYFIEDTSSIIQRKSNHPQVFAIAYETFTR